MIEQAHESGINQLVGCVENLQSFLTQDSSNPEIFLKLCEALRELIMAVGYLEMQVLDKRDIRAFAVFAQLDLPKLVTALHNLAIEKPVLELPRIRLQGAVTEKLTEALLHLTATPVPTIGSSIEAIREQVEQVGL